MNPLQVQASQPGIQQPQQQAQNPVAPGEETAESKELTIIVAKLAQVSTKLDALAHITQQAVMELEAAIEDTTGKKVGALQEELSKVQEQLSAIIEE